MDGAVASYTYGPDGNRIRKDAGGTATEYVYFAGNVIAEKNPATAAWTDYIFGYGGKRIAKDTSTNGSAAQYYQDDHLGTTRVMTDASGTVISNCTFNAFGEQISCSPDNASNHYRYAGKEHDNESDLDDFGARYYSSSMGRWTTPDWSERPMTVPFADFGDPQSLNLYLYVRNDPVSKADADGHVLNEEWGIFTAEGTAMSAKASGCGIFCKVEKVGNFLTGNGWKTNAEVTDARREWLKAHGIQRVDKNGNATSVDWSKAPDEEVNKAYDYVQSVNSAARANKNLVNLLGVTVTFGHGARHLKGTGLNQAEVEAAIQSDIESTVKNATQPTTNFWGRVTVNGQTIEYRAYTLPDTTVNVGTYYVP